MLAWLPKRLNLSSESPVILAPLSLRQRQSAVSSWGYHVGFCPLDGLFLSGSPGVYSLPYDEN